MSGERVKNEVGGPAVIGVAAVQAKASVERYLSEDAFREWVDELMERAVASMPADRPRLVVFPEDFAAGLLLMDAGDALDGATGLRGAVAALVRQHFTAVMGQRMRHRVGWVRALALLKAKDVAAAYRRVFAAAARNYGAYVLAGTVLLPETEFDDDGGIETRGGDVFNAAYLFGPDGHIVGRQRKCFLIDLEGSEALDLSPAPVDDLQVYGTALGRIGTAVCLDGFQEPVVERLRAQEVDIFVKPSANPEPWSEPQQEDWLNGVWKAVVEGGLAAYGVNPMMVGNLLDIQFEGQSSIVARDPEAVAAAAEELGLTLPAADGTLGYTDLEPRRGFLAVAETGTEEEVIRLVLPHPRVLTSKG